MEVEDYLKIWSDCGIKSLDDYKDPIKYSKLRTYSDKFSSEKMDYRNFWIAQEKITGVDGICNCITNKNINNFDIREANKRNQDITECNGFMGWLKLVEMNLTMRNEPAKLMEIGSGYGSLRNHLEKREMDYEYIGFDVHSKFDGVVEVEGKDGCLSESQVDFYKNSFNIAYCVNVFQHLEKSQIEKYINQIHELLYDSRYAMFMAMFCISGTGLADQSYHYGQVIDLPSEWEVNSMIEDKFILTGRSYLPMKPFMVYNLLLEKQ